jgi:hypothetical protein
VESLLPEDCLIEVRGLGDLYVVCPLDSWEQKVDPFEKLHNQLGNLMEIAYDHTIMYHSPYQPTSEVCS